jgi:hypothetical protein
MTEKKGKVVLRLEMDATDAERVVAAFKAGKLAELGIVDIAFPNQPELNPSNEGHADRHRPTKRTEPPHR